MPRSPGYRTYQQDIATLQRIVRFIMENGRGASVTEQWRTEIVEHLTCAIALLTQAELNELRKKAV